jgi:hypothetical protein
MTTEAQVNANRANAQKSTGPRTAEGKAAVAQNAVKHGLSGRADVIKGEDQGEFDRHREALLKELRPDGAVESMLVERVVSLSWRLQRVERIQNEVFDALLADEATPLAKLARSLAGEGAPGEGDLALGRAVLKDFGGSRVLDRLLMYERRMEHSLVRTLKELKQMRVIGYISRQMDEIGAEPLQHSSVPSCQHSIHRPARTGPWPGETPAYSGTPPFQGPNGAPDEPGTQKPSCKTKPISLEANDGQVPWNGEVRENSWQSDTPETKPIPQDGFEYVFDEGSSGSGGTAKLV